MNKGEVQKCVKEIDQLYQEYLGKLQGLKSKQDAILKEFIEKLEEKKLEDIRNKLK